MEAIFPKIALKIAISVFFRGLKSKSGYLFGFSKNIFDEHTYHFHIKVSQSKMNEHFSLQRRKIKEENVPRARFLKYLTFPKF